MIEIRIPHWIVMLVWFVVVVPALVFWEMLQAAWQFLAGDEERPSRWEWVSVILIGLVALGTLGSMQGWWV